MPATSQRILLLKTTRGLVSPSPTSAFSTSSTAAATATAPATRPPSSAAHLCSTWKSKPFEARRACRSPPSSSQVPRIKPAAAAVAFSRSSSRTRLSSRPTLTSQGRGISTSSAPSSPSIPSQASAKPSTSSPVERYDSLLEHGILRDDQHQRSIVSILQQLHETLKTYEQPEVPRPDDVIKVAKAETKKGIMATLFPFDFGEAFNSSKPQNTKVEEDTGYGHKNIPAGIPKGLYLYGDVGTGKSMLMDLFYDSLPPNIVRKRRIHFHQFMIEAHKRAHYYKMKVHKPSGIVMSAANAAAEAVGAQGKRMEEIDPIEPVAREMARSFQVLCFDEFQVTDIADAMILRGLLGRLMSYGVVMVMTSNRHPDDLYKNGIQRNSFIPCIELLKEQLKITDLNSGTDYRKVPRALSKVYFSPINNENRLEFDKIFVALTSEDSDPIVENRKLSIWGRELKVPQSTSKVARFTFNELCGSPKSAADYIEICKRFGTIFVDEVPRMGINQRDLARRFITFIDAAYESKTKLLATSEVPILQIFSGDADKNKVTPDQMRALMDDLGLTIEDLGGSPIFTGDEELFAFARVISRLTEMGSKHYAEISRAPDEAPPEF